MGRLFRSSLSQITKTNLRLNSKSKITKTLKCLWLEIMNHGFDENCTLIDGEHKATMMNRFDNVRITLSNAF